MPPLLLNPYTLLGVTILVGALAGVLVFAILRVGATLRDANQQLKRTGETGLLSVALEETITKLKAQERAMALRAEASERLSEEIIASLSAGLIVVSLDGHVQIVNPAGRRLLGINKDDYRGSDYRTLLARAAPIAVLIEQCLASGHAIVRRSIEIPGA